MFVAMGHLEEVVSGNTWEDEIQTRIFDRLNMTASAPATSTLSAEQQRKFSRCYDSSGGVHGLDHSNVIDCVNSDASGPCGSIISSVEDFVKWQQLHMR